MQDIDFLGRHLLEHQLREQRRHLESVRRERAVPHGTRRSARLIARSIWASRRHGERPTHRLSEADN